MLLFVCMFVCLFLFLIVCLFCLFVVDVVVVGLHGFTGLCSCRLGTAVCAFCCCLVLML